jgi:hypothetical protein
MMRSSPAVRAAFQIGAIIALMATSAWATSNLNLSKSNINRLQRAGTLVSASAEVRGDVPAVVYNTPPNADFVMTQICAGPVNGGIFIAYAWDFEMNVRPVAFVAGGQCQTFSPGMFLPAGKSVTCTPSFDFEAPTFCTITGIQTKAEPLPTPIPQQ